MTKHDAEQWWVAAIGDVLVWARMRLLETGVAEVFDASGETIRFDDENHAYTALLDAEFRSFDGIDDEDAAVMGFDLDSTEPPHANTDEELLPMMTEKLTPGHG
jgi:hypothetical protein